MVYALLSLRTNSGSLAKLAASRRLGVDLRELLPVLVVDDEAGPAGQPRSASLRRAAIGP